MVVSQKNWTDRKETPRKEEFNSFGQIEDKYYSRNFTNLIFIGTYILTVGVQYRKDHFILPMFIIYVRRYLKISNFLFSSIH